MRLSSVLSHVFIISWCAGKQRLGYKGDFFFPDVVNEIQEVVFPFALCSALCLSAKSLETVDKDMFSKPLTQ